MDEQKRYKIQELQIRLNTCDLYSRGTVCNEFLELIRSSENENLKAELCKIVVLHLVDLDRDTDVDFCIDMLMSHNDYHSHLAALWARTAVYRRHNNIDGQLEAFNEGIQIAINHEDDTALSEGYLHRGKVLIQKGQMDNALDDLNCLIPIAEKLSNFNLVAIAQYYIALALHAKGHDELSLQKLREASELACQQHSQSIIMQTEVVRAWMLMKQGRKDVVECILDHWFNEFGLML